MKARLYSLNNQLILKIIKKFESRGFHIVEIVKGMGLLLFTLGLFSLFSFKAPKGSKAMSGLANAAVATFLVEAIHKYISGNF